MDDRKKRIMEHLARSSGRYNLPSAGSIQKSDRKQRIMDHVRRTLGS